MQFIKLIILAIILELLCCFGIIEERRPTLPKESIKITSTEGELENEREIMMENQKGTPQISIVQ